MIKFFSDFKIIFYFFNFLLIFLYLFPGSLLGLAINNDLKAQPQITPNFIVSSNHFFIFCLISILGSLTFNKFKQIKYLVIYLTLLSLILEIFHLIIPERSFQWSDLFGNLFGVIVVFFIRFLINKYEVFKE